MRFRKGQIDSTTIIAVSVAVLALAGVFVFLYVTGFFSPYKVISVGGVNIASVPKSAQIEWVNLTYEKRVRDIYNKYGRVVTETGESHLGYEPARIDAYGKLAERLKVYVVRVTDYAKGYLGEVAQTKGKKNQVENDVNTLVAEVGKVVQKMISKTHIVGATEIVRYKIVENGVTTYYSILYFDPDSIAESIKAQAEIIGMMKSLADKLGEDTKNVFENINKALEEAYKDVPMK